MEDLEEMVRALAQRVEALEQENARLRRQQGRLPEGKKAAYGTTRRRLLAGGAGLLGALAAGGVLERSGHAAAEVGTAETEESAVRAPELARPAVVGLRVTLVPHYSAGHYWAQHDWDLSDYFAGTRPPVVVAAAADDYDGTGAAAGPTCAVQVRGGPGTYRATILVNHLGHLAREVTLNAIAFGE